MPTNRRTVRHRSVPSLRLSRPAGTCRTALTVLLVAGVALGGSVSASASASAPAPASAQETTEATASAPAPVAVTPAASAADTAAFDAAQLSDADHAHEDAAHEDATDEDADGVAADSADGTAAAAALPVAPVTFSSAPEAPSRYQGQVSCDPGEKPGATALRALLYRTYGKANSGGTSRSCSTGGTSEHKEGRAYDWMLNAGNATDKAMADSFLAWLVGPDAQGVSGGNAHRLGVQYVIWNRQTWQSWTGAWKPYTGASPHTDHVHISLSWDGAFARTSWWTGAAATQVDHGPCQVYIGQLAAPWTAPNYTRCAAPVPLPRNPVGSFDSARAVPGGSVVSGWADDADAQGPLQVHAYVDARFAGAFPADRPRGATADGFQLSLPLQPGEHHVCLYGINVGQGTSNTTLGCRTLRPSTGSPVGRLDRADVVPGGIRLLGWGLDPDTRAPVATHVYGGGRFMGVTSASQQRPDVARHYPLMGSARGFDVTMRTPAGLQDVCAYAINAGAGAGNPLLGCRRVRALGDEPMGHLDSVTGGRGTATVSGWALDPSVMAPATVHVYVDGVHRGVVTASGSRPDVGAAYPAWGAMRGVTAKVTGLSAGRHQVCVYGIDQGAGAGNRLLGCAPVVVA